MRVVGTLGAALAGMLLAVSPCAFALNTARDISQYAHTQWRIRDGFTRGYIQSIAQTPDGYLWLGTEFGLVRFDGVKAVPWEPPPDQHLPSSRILSLLVARDGTLWIGTFGGLASWKDGKLTQYPELTGRLILTLLEDRQGAVWAGGFSYTPPGKLCAIQKGSVQCYGDDGGLGQGVVGSYEDSKGNLWLGVLTGLWRWKPGPPRFYPLAGEPNGIQGLAEGDDGALLIAIGGGVARFVDGKTEVAYPYPDPMRQFHGFRALRDRDGGLWVGTLGPGLIHVHGGKTDAFAPSDGLSGDTVSALLEDREGNIWVATKNGLDRFRDFAVATISVNRGSSGAGPVLAARDGSVWLDTDDGLSRWNHGQITVYRDRGPHIAANKPGAQGRLREIRVSGLPKPGLLSLSQDDRGRIWIAGNDGVGYLENDRFVSISGVPGGIVCSLTQDTRGNLWIAHLDHGLFHLLAGSLVEQIPWARLGRKDFATALAADPSQGGLWLGYSQSGLAYFTDGHIRASYTAGNGLGEGRVNDLRLDPDGTLWAATDGGLSRLKNGHVATLTRKNGLPCDALHWVMEDDAHSFWLNMECGLVRIAGSELDAWGAAVDQKKEPKRTIQATVFDSSDGVRSSVYYFTSNPPVAKSPDGKLWFTTLDGVSVVDPLHLPFNKLPPPVHVESVKINGKEVAPEEGLALTHNSNDLEIDYTALSFTNPDRVLFRYMLEGKDADWQNVGTRRQAFYGGLSPRNYRFRVMASNNDGVWNEAGAAWNFSITPAYYQTIWFQALCALAGAALLWLLYRLRVRQVARQLNMRMEERVNERTRIARDLHDTLLQSLAGVSLQLDGISKQAVTHPEKMPSMIGRVREQVDSAFREARVKVWNLRSTSPEFDGLEGALRQLVERLTPSMTARCSVTVSGHPRSCSPDIEEELLRIAQEAANNASQHAQASEIRLALGYSTGSLTLSISDDGRGFNFEEGYRKSGHWGLKNMQERAAQIRATCKIDTAVGQGTRIEVRVPLSSWSLRNTLAKHAHSSSDSR